MHRIAAIVKAVRDDEAAGDVQKEFFSRIRHR